MICPFCGTEVPNGFTVCKGCQAEYQMRQGPLGRITGTVGVLAFLFGFIPLFFAIDRWVGVIWIAAGAALLAISGTVGRPKPAWVRRTVG